VSWLLLWVCLSHTAMFEDLQHNAEPEAVCRSSYGGIDIT